ncbi:hypothetical protein BDV18DRAFT_129754 [Aspergillus unguis]
MAWRGIHYLTISSIMDEVRIVILGDCYQATDLFHKVNRHRAGVDAIDNGTAEQHRDCKVHGQWFWAVTREKHISEVEDLHCFENYSPPDAFVFVYDPAGYEPLRGVETALTKIIGTHWGERVPALSVIPEQENLYLFVRGLRYKGAVREEPYVGEPRDREFTCFPRLPTELQLAVLHSCLVSPYPIIDGKAYLNGINMNILQVNKFFRSEGTRIFRTNRFLPRQSIYILADTSSASFNEDLLSPSQGRALAERFGVQFRHISMDSSRDVDAFFLDIVRECVLRVRDGLPVPGRERNVTFPEEDGWDYRD